MNYQNITQLVYSLSTRLTALENRFNLLFNNYITYLNNNKSKNKIDEADNHDNLVQTMDTTVFDELTSIITDKADINHKHKTTDITDLIDTLNKYSLNSHKHTTSDITDLNLSGYATSEQLTNKANEITSSIANKADTGHKHTTSDITDLNLSNYITNEQLEEKITTLNNSIDEKARSNTTGINEINNYEIKKYYNPFDYYDIYTITLEKNDYLTTEESKIILKEISEEFDLTLSLEVIDNQNNKTTIIHNNITTYILNNYNGFINGSSSYAGNGGGIVITEYKERKAILFMIPYKIIENYWYDYSVGSAYKEIYILINGTTGSSKAVNVKIPIKNVSIIDNNKLTENTLNDKIIFVNYAFIEQLIDYKLSGYKLYNIADETTVQELSNEVQQLNNK